MMTGFPAYFSSGLSAGRVEAMVTLAPGRLEVLDRDGALLAGWRYKDLRLQQPARPNEPLRLMCLSAPDARLAILNAAAAEQLMRHLPAISGIGHGGFWRVLGWTAGSGVAIALLAWALYAALPLLAAPVAHAVPVTWEETWGDSVAQSMLMDMKACSAGSGAQALNALVAEIVTANGISRKFELHVVKDKAVNAFATPGGHIVILSGLIDDAQDPDELAGVLAHEMAHVVERHAMERLVRAAGVGLVLTWVTGDPSSVIASVGSMLANLSYSRADESEADDRAVAMLGAAGFATGGINSFFLRLGEHQGMDSLVPELLSTHPRATDRAAAHQAQPGRKPLGDLEWQAVKEMCR